MTGRLILILILQDIMISFSFLYGRKRIVLYIYFLY